MTSLFGRVFGLSARPKAEEGTRTPQDDARGPPNSFGARQKFPTMAAISLDPEYAWIVGDAPASALEVPSMMSPAERRALYNFTARRYSGRGVIIDAGIFLGASTRCFGEAINANENRTEISKNWPKPIISFERGVINPNMPTFFRRNNVEIREAAGGSFVGEIEKNIGPIADLVDLRIGDIVEKSADISSPVEILFLDVLKLPQISKSILSKFFPLLIPGVSIVVQQDYFHDRLPYICVDQEFFREYFDYIGEIGSTAIFRCAKAVPNEAIERFKAGVNPAEQPKLSSIAMQRSIDPARRFLVALSKVRLIFRLSGIEAAKVYLEHVKDDFPEQCVKFPQLLEVAEEFVAFREELRERNRQARGAKAAPVAAARTQQSKT